MNIQQDPGKSGSTLTTSSTAGVGTPRQDVSTTARDAVTKLSDAAQEIGTQAKQAATSLASEVNENIKGILNQQVGVGANLVGHVAHSVRTAADDLKQNAPQLAVLVRGAADQLEEFSSNVRHQSVDDLFETASNFARRQPAVVFGAAAALGFLLFRILKAAPSNGVSRNDSTRDGLEGRLRDQQAHGAYGGNGMTGGQTAGSRPGQAAGQRHGV